MARKVPNAPSRGLWLVAVIVGGLGILAHFFYIRELTQHSYWMLMIGFLLLVFGTSSRGL